MRGVSHGVGYGFQTEPASSPRTGIDEGTFDRLMAASWSFRHREPRLVAACATGMMLAAVLDGCEDRGKVRADARGKAVGLGGRIRRREWRKLWIRGNVPAR
jgi:hypothetical protein